MQNPDDIQPCYPLFRQPDFKKSIGDKKQQFEEGHAADKVLEVFDWTTSKEYQDINFAREALTVDPAKACQPLGAVLCASGFHKTLPYVHGSQGCVAYFRTYFNRHFKEPCSCVSDSMTEDSAVFGGQSVVFDGLANAKALYDPDIIAVSTTCMAEVIGDDLNAFINNAKNAGKIAQDFPVPFAHTPSFVGSHTTGWDNMEEGILNYFTKDEMEGKKAGSKPSINLVPGFETYLGNYRVVKRMLREMDVDHTMLSDASDVFDTPADGHFRMYAGGTTIEEIKDAPNAITTVMLQPFHLVKTKKFVEESWKHQVPTLNIPMGVDWTDAFLMKLAELTGKPIPDSLKLERGRCMDLITDSYAWLHGKKYALFGDPDFVIGMVKILLEVGAEPIHILSHNGNPTWAKAVEELLASSPFGVGCKVYPGRDLWHLRSLCFTEKPDFLIGNSYGKYIQRDTFYKGAEYEVPLVRFGFPIHDRHHLHRQTTLGYEGMMSIITQLTNAVLDQLDRQTMGMGTTDYNFDLVR